jgi:hypothetical protein
MRNGWFERLKNIEYVVFKDGYKSTTFAVEAGNELENLSTQVRLQQREIGRLHSLITELERAKEKSFKRRYRTIPYLELEQAVKDGKISEFDCKKTIDVMTKML